MAVDMPRPEPLEMDAYGARTSYLFYAPFTRVHSVFNRNTTAGDTIHYMDPAIEVYFRILGESGAKLSLRLWTGRCLPVLYPRLARHL
jgi:hypothetical protein